MNSKITSLIVLTFVAILVIGCGSSPTPVSLPTQPPVVITVIITATPPPPTATFAPSITPLPTLPLTTTVTSNTPVVAQPTSGAGTPSTPRPSATKRPTTVSAATPTASPLPLKYAAPTLIEPLWTDEPLKHDERKYPSGALTFKWRALGGFNGDECYLVSVTFSSVNPGGPGPKGDSFLSNCADQTRIDYPVQFTLNQPRNPGPNYASLMIDSSEIWVDWTVTAVKNLGQCVDDYHCKTAPLSPPGKGRFLLRGS